MRLFIALDLKELEPYFKKLQAQLPEDVSKLKLVNTFHLTLKFLGETDKADEIILALQKIKVPELKLTLTNIGVFPSESYVRVIWVGLKENKQLMQLQKDIESALEPFHFRKDFEFLPHLTLARVKFISNKQDFLERLKNIKVEPKEIILKEFKLIKSELTKEGPVYTDLSIFQQPLHES